MKMAEKKTVKKEKKVKEVKETPKPVVDAKPVVSKDCGDKKCPFHGDVTTHGRVFIGTVIKDKMHRTVNVEWPRSLFIAKYERFEKRRSRVKAHNPACMNVKVGDKVKIAECRPLAKTVNFVVIERLK